MVNLEKANQEKGEALTFDEMVDGLSKCLKIKREEEITNLFADKGISESKPQENNWTTIPKERSNIVKVFNKNDPKLAYLISNKMDMITQEFNPSITTTSLINTKELTSNYSDKTFEKDEEEYRLRSYLDDNLNKDDMQAIVNFLTHLPDNEIIARYGRYINKDDVMKTLEKIKNIFLLYSNDASGSELLGVMELFPDKYEENANELSFIVHPEHQSKGLGSMLVETVINFCFKNYPTEPCKLYVSHSNDSAIKFTISQLKKFADMGHKYSSEYDFDYMIYSIKMNS